MTHLSPNKNKPPNKEKQMTTTAQRRSDSTPAVEIRDLKKNFGHTKALDGLDLTVEHGSIAGFLGPNGAGKSTTIRVLLGLLKADGGTVCLLGGDPWHDAVSLHRRIAYVPGDVTLWPNLTGGQAIDFLARLRGGNNVKRREQLIERFELDPHKKARTYSKGNRQKVAIIAAFSSDVELYILDEPTSGLDPLMEKAFQQSVKEVAERGAAVLLSSHILAEVEQLCDMVTIIRAGRAVRSGRLEDLRHLMRTTVKVRTRAGAGALRSAPFVHDLSETDGMATFSVDRADLDRAMNVLTDLGIAELSVFPASLEDLFLREYQGALR
jgi:ABC-2 type transport system ATP-binding protein